MTLLILALAFRLFQCVPAVNINITDLPPDDFYKTDEVDHSVVVRDAHTFEFKVTDYKWIRKVTFHGDINKSRDLRVNPDDGEIKFVIFERTDGSWSHVCKCDKLNSGDTVYYWFVLHTTHPKYSRIGIHKSLHFTMT